MQTTHSSRKSQPSAVFWRRLLGVALALRLVVALGLLGSMPLVSDAVAYADQARQILAAFPGAEAYYRPPGLPYLLALLYAAFGDGLPVSRMAAVLISVLNVAMTTRVAGCVLRDARAVRATGWLAAVYPPAVLMAGQPYAQPLELLCVLLALYLLCRARQRGRAAYAVPAALAFGYGCLTRPGLLVAGVALVGVWVLWLWRHARTSPEAARRVGGGGLVFGLIVLACLVPPASHNARQGAGWTVSTNNERNLFLGNNPYTPHYKTSLFSARPLDTLPPEVSGYLRRFLEREDARQAMLAEVRRYVAAHPWITLRRTLNRIRAFWGFDYVMARRIQMHFGWGTGGLMPVLLLEGGGYVAVMLLVLIGFFGSDAWRRPRGRLLIVLVLAYQLPYALAFATGTYHFTAMALLLPFAGAALAGRHGWSGLRDNRRLWVAVAVFLAIQAEYLVHTLIHSPAP